MTTTPKIYVASLSDYNAGRLHGKWIDATQDIDDVWAEIKTMLAASPEFRVFPQGGPAEEWAIHDYEGFGDYSLHEYESIDKVVMLAQAMEEAGEAVAAFVSNDSTPLDEANGAEDLLYSFREAYVGTYNSERDFAEQLVEDIGLPGIGQNKINLGRGWDGREHEVDLLDELSSYLDWGALTRWALEDHWTWTDSDYSVHVFRDYH